MSNEQEKRDNENYAKNFTRICNIVLESYKHLTHEEKFLYVKMRSVYWDAKPRFATLREISHLTGYTISALSRILPRLHKCGLVHAEIKQEYNPDGTKKGKPKYYITIPDIWELNRKYFECSPEERFDPSDVLLENKNVPLKNNNVLQKNENVLVENDVVPPEEHFRGAKASSRAGSQLPKDNKDIYKDSKKEREADSTQMGTPSSLPSSPSFNVRNTEPLLSAEGKQVRDYWCELGYEDRGTSTTHWNTLSKHVSSLEQMDSLLKHTQVWVNNNPRITDKQVHPGNLVYCLNGWKQAQIPLPSKQATADPSKPFSVSGLQNLTYNPPPPAVEEPGEKKKLPEFKLRRMKPASKVVQ